VITKCEISLLLLDTKEGISKQDIRIASFVAENYKSSIIVYNKWDLAMSKHEVNKQEYIQTARDRLTGISYSPVMFCSAKSGYHVRDVINKAIEIAKNRHKKITNQKILKSISTATLMRQPPEKNGKRLKIKYVTQADMGAPTFTFFVNNPDLQNDQYDRFLENRLREDFPSLEGSPVRLLFRKNVTKLSRNLAKGTIPQKKKAKDKKGNTTKKEGSLKKNVKQQGTKKIGTPQQDEHVKNNDMAEQQDFQKRKIVQQQEGKIKKDMTQHDFRKKQDMVQHDFRKMKDTTQQDFQKRKVRQHEGKNNKGTPQKKTRFPRERCGARFPKKESNTKRICK